MLKQAVTKSIKRLACLLAVAALSGCGGSSSNTQTVFFVDSAVEGLNYKSNSFIGVTGPNGEYQYKSGEVITFSVGDVVTHHIPALQNCRILLSQFSFH